MKKDSSLTDEYRDGERQALTEQTQQAPVGESTNEQSHFLHVSLGSCAELETQFMISGRRLYMSDKENKIYLEGLNEEMSILANSIHKLVIDGLRRESVE